MTTDCNSRYIYLDPEMGGKIAVAEAARNIVCSGGEPLAITDCLNFGNPEKPEIFWQIEKSVDGMSEACRTLQTPVIGGNVSMYNERSGEAVYPTPTVGMVGLVHDLKHVTTQEFKQAGDLVYIIGETKAEFGGSELQKMLHGKIFGQSPSIDLDVELKRQKQVLAAIQAGLIQSAHDVAEGGLAVAISESAIGANGLGATVKLDGEATAALFAESQSRFVITVKRENKEAFEKAVEAIQVGEVTNTNEVTIHNEENEVLLTANVDEMRKAWKGAIPCLLK